MIMDPNFQAVSFGVLSVLASINVFFISRLIKKIDDSAERVNDLKKDMQFLSEKVSQLSDMSGRIIELEKRFAILDYKLHGDRRQEEG